jgi:phosphocarrier protein
LHFREYTVNAKSLLGILMLAAAKGSKIRVEACGEDASLAVDAIIKLAKNKFFINY